MYECPSYTSTTLLVDPCWADSAIVYWCDKRVLLLLYKAILGPILHALLEPLLTKFRLGSSFCKIDESHNQASTCQNDNDYNVSWIPTIYRARISIYSRCRHISFLL